MSAGCFHLLFGKSEATLSVLILHYVGTELVFAVVRPISGSYDKFGICNLIEEEIAHTEIASGTDKQIGVGHTCRRKRGRKEFFVDFIRVDTS